MKDISYASFGLLIAYNVPGFAVLLGLAPVSETVRSWLGASTADAPTIAGFFYATLASIAAGMTISTLRWLLIDALHRATGMRWREWDFSHLKENVAAFHLLIEIHYRYYQFYGGMMVALAIAYFTHRFSLGFWTTPLAWLDLFFALLEIVFFLGSRDTLQKYVERGEMLFGTACQEKAGFSRRPTRNPWPTSSFRKTANRKF